MQDPQDDLIKQNLTTAQEMVQQSRGHFNLDKLFLQPQSPAPGTLASHIGPIKIVDFPGESLCKKFPGVFRFPNSALAGADFCWGIEVRPSCILHPRLLPAEARIFYRTPQDLCKTGAVHFLVSQMYTHVHCTASCHVNIYCCSSEQCAAMQQDWCGVVHLHLFADAGKGRGVVAARNVKAGELLAVDNPLQTAHVDKKNLGFQLDTTTGHLVSFCNLSGT